PDERRRAQGVVDPGAGNDLADLRPGHQELRAPGHRHHGVDRGDRRRRAVGAQAGVSDPVPLSWESRALPCVLRLTRRGACRRAQSARDHIDQRALRPQPYGPPTKLRSDVSVRVARRSGWPIYTLAPTTSPTPRRTVVYLHGGAWVNEIAPQH